MISDYLQNKILSYNVHPVAELLKPIFLAYIPHINDLEFYEFIRERNISKEYCWDCHKNIDNMIHLPDKNFCEDCWEYIDPNDDVISYTSFGLVELRTNIYSVMYRMKCHCLEALRYEPDSISGCDREYCHIKNCENS